jgi:hypothetical protein
MIIWLRIIVSCFCIVLCALFGTMWVRSYQQGTIIGVAIFAVPNPNGASPIWEIGCSRGQIRIIHAGRFPNLRRVEWKWYTTKPFDLAAGVKNGRIMVYGDEFQVTLLPLWLLTLTNSLIAILIRPKPWWRFRLLELCILSTTVAIISGFIAMLPKIHEL